MPFPCFSYPADVQPGARKRNAGQASPRDPQIGYPCFSYSKLCFSYPADVPLGIGTATPRSHPCPACAVCTHTCFRY